MVDILDRDIDCRRCAAEVFITDDELKTERTPSDRNAGRHESWMDWIAQIKRDCRSGQLGPRILAVMYQQGDYSRIRQASPRSLHQPFDPILCELPEVVQESVSS